MYFAPQRRALFRHLNLQKWSEALVFLTFWLRNVLHATTACTFSTSQLPKVVRSWCVFNILTSKCASRHNGVHFFDIATSKSGPTLVCFVHFDFGMCFAPQRRALFWHCNFQKWSAPGVLSTFWLGNVLRATTACNFSSLIWPAGSAPAALASLLFDPPEPQIIGKTQCLATFVPFHASASSFFLYSFSSTLLSSNLSLLSASCLLCFYFSSVNIVGSLTSKLPSLIFTLRLCPHVLFFVHVLFHPYTFRPETFSPTDFSPIDISPTDFSPADFSPTDLHPYTFHPQIFHPQTLHTQTFHPYLFHPYTFDPRTFHPQTVHLRTVQL